MESIVQQVIGVADAKVEAPNCQPIRPKLEPIAENVKYILFDFSMAEIDLYMLEGNGLMKLQVWFPINRIVSSTFYHRVLV